MTRSRATFLIYVPILTRRDETRRDEPRREPAKHDRPVWTNHHLSARFGHRPLRIPLRLLHGGRDELPAEIRAADPGRARPRVQRVRQARRPKAAPDRR